MTEEVFKDFVSRYYFKAKEDNPEFYQVYLHDNSFTYSVLGPDDLVIGAFGINLAWKGVGEVWLMSTDELNSYPLWLVKTFRKLTTLPLESGSLHRIQMFVDNNDPKLHRWAKTLGFTLEGVMRKHSSDKTDHAVYAKTV